MSKLYADRAEVLKQVALTCPIDKLGMISVSDFKDVLKVRAYSTHQTLAHQPWASNPNDICQRLSGCLESEGFGYPNQ